jgi:hypothetical protein
MTQDLNLAKGAFYIPLAERVHSGAGDFSSRNYFCGGCCCKLRDFRLGNSRGSHQMASLGRQVDLDFKRHKMVQRCLIFLMCYRFIDPQIRQRTQCRGVKSERVTHHIRREFHPLLPKEEETLTCKIHHYFTP